MNPSGILKFTKIFKFTKNFIWKTSLENFLRKKSVLWAAYFRTIVVIVVIKILDKSRWRSSLLERSLETLCQYIYLGFEPQIREHLFWRTVPLAVSAPCSILVGSIMHQSRYWLYNFIQKNLSSFSTVILILQN